MTRHPFEEGLQLKGCGAICHFSEDEGEFFSVLFSLLAFYNFIIIIKNRRNEASVDRTRFREGLGPRSEESPSEHENSTRWLPGFVSTCPTSRFELPPSLTHANPLFPVLTLPFYCVPLYVQMPGISSPRRGSTRLLRPCSIFTASRLLSLPRRRMIMPSASSTSFWKNPEVLPY